MKKMCKLGDIIVVNKYIGDDGKIINKHSFVVINDQPGFIENLDYDFVTNVMSSFKSEEQRIKKLRFEENIEILSENIISWKKAFCKRRIITVLTCKIKTGTHISMSACF